MNKTEMIEAISASTRQPKSATSRIIEAFLAEVSDQLQAGNEVRIQGFGAFSLKTRSARTGRNPRTGETITIAEAKVPTFKPGKELKDACNS